VAIPTITINIAALKDVGLPEAKFAIPIYKEIGRLKRDLFNVSEDVDFSWVPSSAGVPWCFWPEVKSVAAGTGSELAAAVAAHKAV